MTFPSTPVIDDFNRADEGPPLSVAVGWKNELTLSGLQIISNVATGSSGFAWNDMQYWGTPTAADCEVYCDVPTLPGIGNYIDLFARVNPYFASYANPRYRASVARAEVILYKESSGHIIIGSYPPEPQFENPIFVAGDSLGLRCVGSTISVWIKHGGTWTEVISVTDTEFTEGGYIGVNVREVGTITIDNFGGGSIGPPPPIPPVADFVGSPLSGPVSLDVDFTDLSTNTPTGWAWDFGDTYTASSQNPSHIYDSIGLFTVALTATNADGSDTETKVDYINVLGPPVADFSGTPTSGLVSLSVVFTDLSTNSPDTWLWDFGDGGSSTSQNPNYVYTHVGVYTVTLTASSSAGSDSETKIAYITVTDIMEYGAAIVENCDLDTGGAAVGLRVANVAIARDNILGSLTIDASAELRMKDNAYSVLVNNGTPNQLAGDRAAFDTATYFDRHASDIDDNSFVYHVNPADAPLGSSLGPGSFYIGNALGVAVATGMSGDATLDSSGVLTITAQAVDASNVAMTNGSFFIGGADGAAHEQNISGDASITNAGVLTLATVNANVGTYGDATNLAQITVDAKGRITAIGEIAFTGGGQHVELVVDGLIPANPALTPDGSDFVYAYVSD